MSKYFNRVTSYSNLKDQYFKLLKLHHPDNGGDVEIMQEINAQYEALFKIWKDRQESETGEKVEETAQSTKMHFYTANGWAGSNYNGNLTLKEIAKIVRYYVKEKYPTCKFSIRTKYASMCQELHAELLELPAPLYKTVEDLKNEGLTEVATYEYNGEIKNYEKYKEEVKKCMKYLRNGGILNKDVFTDEDFFEAYKIGLEKYPDRYAIKTEYLQSVLDDVNGFIQSYNYEDIDGMIDYCDVNFYFTEINSYGTKYVPKTARIAPNKNEVSTTDSNSQEEPEQIRKKYTYVITKGNDTRDGSELWTVKIKEKLTREEYLQENAEMKKRGAYYSRYLHGFIFRVDPAELLAM